MCCRMGVDICGFVTDYPLDVPWNLTGEQCAKLLSYVTSPAKSCIVTGGERDKVISLALTLRPDYVQLHYKETLEDTDFIVQALSSRNIKIIKTIPSSEEERYRQFGTADLESCTQKLCHTGVAAILVDSRGPSNAASGGSSANLSLYQKVKASADCPVMLGGGITPDNCNAIMAKAQPDILDVMTGVETAPGLKSETLVSDLVSCLK